MSKRKMSKGKMAQAEVEEVFTCSVCGDDLTEDCKGCDESLEEDNFICGDGFHWHKKCWRKR